MHRAEDVVFDREFLIPYRTERAVHSDISAVLNGCPVLVDFQSGRSFQFDAEIVVSSRIEMSVFSDIVAV
jgi:hypothetical protein